MCVCSWGGGVSFFDIQFSIHVNLIAFSVERNRCPSRCYVLEGGSQIVSKEYLLVLIFRTGVDNILGWGGGGVYLVQFRKKDGIYVKIIQNWILYESLLPLNIGPFKTNISLISSMFYHIIQAHSRDNFVCKGWGDLKAYFQ